MWTNETLSVEEMMEHLESTKISAEKLTLSAVASLLETLIYDSDAEARVLPSGQRLYVVSISRYGVQ